MTLLVDSSVGSHDLVAPLLEAGLPVEETRLKFGDVAFIGKGLKSALLDIGVELKRSDLVSSLRSGRLAGHQLPGLLGPNGAYDYAWLLLEGLRHVNALGQIVEHNDRRRRCHVVKGLCDTPEHWDPAPGRMSATERDKQILTLDVCGGFHIWHTLSRADTVQFIATLYRWWSDKSLEKHQSHLAVYRPASFVPVTKQQEALMGLPDVGRKVALAAEKHFGSLRRACNASVQEWASLETITEEGKTKRLGLRTAEHIVKFCGGNT